MLHAPAIAYLITDRTYLVSFAGDLVESSAPQLERELDRLLEAGARDVVVDLSDVMWVESSALEQLVAFGRRALRAGTAIALACGDKNVVRVFELIGMRRLAAIEPTVTDAFARIAKRGDALPAAAA